MARNGLFNPETATRLFISPRAVQYHWWKAFTKLGITSRSQLDRVPQPSLTAREGPETTPDALCQRALPTGAP